MSNGAVEGSPTPTRIGRAAPVAYTEARPRLQRYRLAAAILILLITTITGAFGSGGSFVSHTAALVLVADAVYRLRREHAPVWSFLVDAVTIGLIVSLDAWEISPLIALLAYLLIGTILYTPQPGTIWVMATAALTFSLSEVTMPVLGTSATNAAAAAAVWAELAVLFALAGFFLLNGATNVSTARSRQTEALESERRASEMKTEFVSMVSHELRTPLTNITGFAVTLHEAWRTLDPPEIDEFLGIIRSEAEHLGNLVDDVLAIPRLETGSLLVDVTDFALRPLAFRIAELVFPAGGEREATLQVPGNAIVKADPNRVEQIFRNLLTNARKYGGDRVVIEASRRGEEYVIVVADNGHGVPEDHRERIFDQFEQVSRGDTRTGTGVGLGLSVTRSLVEAMGGKVWYEPGFPIGARFCFTLPAGTADE
jgi:signal transduction histidine kinase